MQDLFRSPALLPENVRVVVESFSENENDYESCKQLEALLQPLGYTFDWGLDAEPTFLRKITLEEPKFKQAIKELMQHDPNGAWCEIEDECDGDYLDAYHELVLCLGQALEDNEEARPFYKSILESLIIQ